VALLKRAALQLHCVATTRDTTIGSSNLGINVEVWGVAQRRGCLRGMLSLHAEMLVSPNATNNEAA